MERLIRLNEVQYAETEHHIAGLMAQGFHEEALTAPTEETIPASEKPEPNPAPEKPEPNPVPENPEPTDGKKGGK